MPRRLWLTLWLLSGVLAFILCMYELPAALVDGQFVPADHDSFYHARRIIDALPDLSAFYQFDPRIHAPEGSWITWPWAYDWLMAAVTKLVMAVTGIHQPMAVIAFIAPLWVFVNGWLLLRIAQQLRLSFALQCVVLLCFSVSMLTRSLHRVGMVDHHYIEHTFVLATLLAGLRWFRAPDDWRRGAWLGAVLGLAPAFHNGDFILQLPVLVAVGVLWLRDAAPGLRGARALAVTLPAVTLLMALPSAPLWRGSFDFTLLSWFHVYVAVCTGLMVLLLARLPRRAASVLALVALALVLALPVLGQAARGSGFLLGSFEQIGAITEIQSVFGFILSGQASLLTRLYSALLWLSPAGLFWVWWRLRRRADPAAWFLAVYASFGIVLLFFQFRLQYFGAFTLWLLPAVAAQDCCAATPQRARIITAIAGAVMLLASLPGLTTLRYTTAAGGDRVYAQLRPMFLALHDHCAARPGIVLAYHNLGHYITYHSDCSVIADAFIITRQHEEKVRLTTALLAGDTRQALKAAPYLRYVLVERQDAVGIDTCFPQCAANAGLRHELLERGAPFPSELRLLGEIEASVHGVDQPLARLFVVTTAPDAAVDH